MHDVRRMYYTCMRMVCVVYGLTVARAHVHA